MADFLTLLTTGLDVILTGVTSVCTTIVSTPFLLFTTIFLFAGGVVGIIGRILISVVSCWIGESREYGYAGVV